MEWDALVAAVGRFGLSERESLLYLSLLRRGRATARELARDAQVDRVLGYRMLEAMRARGIVEVTAERPRRFTAAPPRSFFERSLRDRRTALEKDVDLAEQLSERLPILIRENETGGAPRVQLLTGAATIYDYLREMVGRSRSDLAVMVTHRALKESVGAGLHTWLPKFLTAGGRFRLVVESDPRLRPLLMRFGDVSEKYPNAEVRQLSPQPTRMTIVDRSEAMIFIVPESKFGQFEEVAVWTDNPEFVLGQLLSFELAWVGAGSFGPHAPRRARAPPPRRGPRSRKV
ncbi:MAG: hypothetical protein L3J86_02160 [Thermoplasmata archaeon]|nr:hypothetical protein [Thermoplasmata archaeon]